MNLLLIQLGENIYKFVWNTHHLITDGWSTSLLLEEVFQFYHAFCQGEELQLESPRPYRDYIKWLYQQNLAQSETFWRQKLTGFSAPNHFRNQKTLSQQKPRYTYQQMIFSASESASLRSFVRHHKITLNTLAQAAWAVILSYYSGDKDIVFGVIVSGRPVTLAVSESMLGLLINILPLRIQMLLNMSVVDFLKHVQSQQAEISQYEYSPLFQVHEWSKIPKNMFLFDSILVFQNYPVDTEKRRIENLQISDVVVDERTHYPLTVTVIPSQELLLDITYDSCKFDDNAIELMLINFRELFIKMMENPQGCLSELPLL
jgi:hypothetical protein